MRRHGNGLGRSRVTADPIDAYNGARRRGGIGFGFGSHGTRHHGRRHNRPSAAVRIAYLEDFQRDLEEMTADVASQLARLSQRESEKTTP